MRSLAISVVGIVVSALPVFGQQARLPADTSGFNIAAAMPERQASGEGRGSYTGALRRRTRNRVLLDLALNYSQTSFISGGYLDPFKPKKKPYLIHSDLSLQLGLGGEWSAYPVLLSPRFKVRMFSEDTPAHDISLPVRTPSFMPGITVFHTFQKELTMESVDVWFTSLSLGHHSNGQDGPEFSSPGVFNQYNGNFSNNFIEPAVCFRHRYNGKPDPHPAYAGAHKPYADLFVRIGYEINVRTAVKLRSTYGSGHINLSGGYIKSREFRDIHKPTGEPFDKPYYRETYRVLFNASVVTGQRNFGLGRPEKRVNIESSFHWHIPRSPNTALMLAAGYYGSDPYNIYFGDSYWYARTGISASIFVAAKRPQH